LLRLLRAVLGRDAFRRRSDSGSYRRYKRPTERVDPTPWTVTRAESRDQVAAHAEQESPALSI